MCAGEKAAAAVMPIVQRSVWRGAILCFPVDSIVVLALLQRIMQPSCLI